MVISELPTTSVPPLGKTTQLSHHLHGNASFAFDILPFTHQLDLEVLGIHALNHQLPFIIGNYRTDLDVYSPNISAFIYRLGNLSPWDASRHLPRVG